MTYAIEQGIPIPPSRSLGAGRPDSLMGTLRRLDVGQSIFVAKPSKSVGCISKIPGKKYTTRAVEGGTRIWRIQ
jgi:hypothetical protein